MLITSGLTVHGLRTAKANFSTFLLGWVSGVMFFSPNFEKGLHGMERGGGVLIYSKCVLCLRTVITIQLSNILLTGMFWKE